MDEIGLDAGHRDLVVVGTSAGGVMALPRLLAQLPRDFAAAVLVVQHLTPESSMRLAEIVQRHTPLRVAWGEHGDTIRAGEVLIAPPGIHMLVERTQIVLAGGPRENHSRPSIDILFRSAAAHHGCRVIGVLLTGMLDDGVQGLAAIRKAGGVVVVQDPADAAFADLPRAAIASVEVDHVAPIDTMGVLLGELVRQTPLEAPIPDDLALEAEHDSREIVLPGGIVATTDHETERALWAAVRSLQERASALAKLARDQRMVGSELATHYERRSAEAYADATRARRFLLDRQRRRSTRTLSAARRPASGHRATLAARRARRA